MLLSSEPEMLYCLTCFFMFSSSALLLSEILDDMVICKQENIPAGIISIDQMKTFDRVNWAFMYKTVQAFGFQETFVKWIKLLYSGAKSIVKVNGFLSDPFQTQCRV